MRYSKSKTNAMRLVRNQLSSLFLNDTVTTTQSRASALKREAEKIISLLKQGEKSTGVVRLVKSTLYGGAQKKAMDEAKSISSVKIFKLGNRSGDNAPITKVILVKKEVTVKTKTKKDENSKNKR